MAKVRTQDSKKQSRLPALAMVLILAGYLAAVHTRSPRPVGLVAEAARKPLPTLALTEMGGDHPWRSTDHGGEVVVICLWATWCGPCQEELPMLSRLAKEMRPQGIAMVGISLDAVGSDRERRVTEFVRKAGVTYPIAFAEEMSQMTAGLDGLPTTILVDRKGRVALTYVGSIGESELRSDLARLMAE